MLPPETAQRSRGYERPADEIETAIAQIWSPVLGVEKVGRNDNFFELGGHSLRAAQAIAQLQDKFYVDLTLPTLFEKPTVAALADEIRRAVSGVSQTHIPRKGNISRAPASLIQQRFWFLDRNIADRTIYNVSEAIRLKGPLDLTALRKAWQALVDRQDSLRTTFESVDGWPEQIIHSPSVVSLALSDFSGRDDAKSEAGRHAGGRCQAAV